MTEGKYKGSGEVSLAAVGGVPKCFFRPVADIQLVSGWRVSNISARLVRS